jgi:hypothetical protein
MVALLALRTLGGTPTQEQGLVPLLVYLSLGAAVGGSAFALVAYLLKVEEVRILLRRGWALLGMIR